MSKKYCQSIFNYKRSVTSEVIVGDVKMGGTNPLCIQSMTNTDTKDIYATIGQCQKIFNAGGDLVRITIPSVSDVENLISIKNGLINKKVTKPLSADVHFTSEIALKSAKVIEKVRINPGNYVRQANLESTENNEALLIISDKLKELVEVCIENKTALRIGVNHGSLSARIVKNYGDTPNGMVESAMEFLRILKHLNFDNVIVSLKSSNVKVMVIANRLLVTRMKAEGFNFPLHLGVTEAGAAEDGRIKSALGIGSLLQDGIGDTIRVSLTEDPEFEIPVCRSISVFYDKLAKSESTIKESDNIPDPFSFSRMKSNEEIGIGGTLVPVVITDLSKVDSNIFTEFEGIKPDFIYYGKSINRDIASEIPAIVDYEIWGSINGARENIYPLMNLQNLNQTEFSKSKIRFLELDYRELNLKTLDVFKYEKGLILIIKSEESNFVGSMRSMILRIREAGCRFPIVISRRYNDDKDFVIKASCEFGPLFIDGYADGLMIDNSSNYNEGNSVAFKILQASRSRITRPDYISCPGCGRTLFDLNRVSEEIRMRTSHLKGVKIGIMGCIVNGPGEMADADFGYVGSLKGKVTLYVGKKAVNKNIPEKNAVNELIEIIKDNGMWIDPPE